MAINIAHRCQFPQDLEAATDALNQDLSDRMLANQDLLSDAVAASEGIAELINEGNDLLSQILNNNTPPAETRPTTEKEKLVGRESLYETGSDIRTLEDISDVFGLPKDEPTVEDQEKYIANAGVILIDGVVYPPPQTNDIANIEILRRLYFASSTDLALTEQRLLNENKTFIIQSKLNFIEVAALKPNYVEQSLEQIQKDLGMPWLTYDYIGIKQNSKSIVLTKSYISMNKSKTLTSKNSGVAESELVSDIFHVDTILKNTAAISTYSGLGYTGQELQAIIAGKDLVNVSITYIRNKMYSSYYNTLALINEMAFVYNRFDSYTNQSLIKSQLKFSAAIVSILKAHTEIIALTEFKVSTILNKNILSALRTKHSDETIAYILEKRPEVTGVYVDAPDNAVLKVLQKALSSAPPGSTYISNQAINNTTTAIIDMHTLMQMYAYLTDAKDFIDFEITKNSLIKSRASLLQYLQLSYGSDRYYTNITPLNGITEAPIEAPVTDAATQPTEILQGQPSMAAPSGILMGNFVATKTLDLLKKLQALFGSFESLKSLYPPAITNALIDIIEKIANIFEKAFAYLDIIIAKASKGILALKNKIDAFVSKYLTLVGSGSFETSLLKCAVNWDIGLSTDIIDALSSVLNKLASLAVGFVNKIKDWVSDLLNRVLCMPIDMINNWLQVGQLALPSACRIPKFDLPSEVTAALEGLLNIGTSQSIVFNSLGGDLLKLRINLDAATDKLNQFTSSSLCKSNQISNFQNASMLNIGVSVASPI